MPATRAKEEEDEEGAASGGSFASCESLPHSPRADKRDDDIPEKEAMPSHWGMPEAAEDVSGAKSPATGPLAGFRSALSGLRGGSEPASPEKPAKPTQEVVSDDDDIPESLRPKLLSEGAAAEVTQATAAAAEQMPGHWGMADSEEREAEPAAVPSPGRLEGLRRAVSSRLAGGSAGAGVATDIAVVASASVEEMPSQYEMPEIQEEVAADVPSHWGMPTQDDKEVAADVPSHWGVPTQDDDEEKVAPPSHAQGFGSRLAGLKNVIPGLRGRSASQEAATKLPKQDVDKDDDDDDIPESIRSKRLSADSEAKAAEALDSAAEEMPCHWGMAQAHDKDDADIIAAAVNNIPSQCEMQEVSEESAVDLPSHWGITELPDKEAEVQQTPAGSDGRLAGLKRVISARLGGNSEGLKSDEEVAAIMAASAAEELPSQSQCERPGVLEESAVDVPSHWGITELPDEEATVQQAPAGSDGRLAGLKRVISARLGGNSEGLKSDEEVAAIMAASAAEELPSQYAAQQ